VDRREESRVHPLRRARREAGRSVADLAREVNVTRATIYALEEGRNKGNIDTWIKLAVALDTTVDELVEGMLERELAGKA